MTPTHKIEKMPDSDLLRVNKFLLHFKCRSIHCEECLFSDDSGICYSLLIFNEARHRGLFCRAARKRENHDCIKSN